jgi:hypothetical protein
VQVSGKAFLGLITYIRETHGADSLSRIVAISGDSTRLVFKQRIQSSSWYYYDAFSSFLASADKVFGTGDLAYCKTLGAQAGKRDLNTVYKLLLRMRNPESLIQSCTRVWESYYRDAGEMVAVQTAPTGTALRITNCPKMHPAHCRLMEGWMIQAMDMIGCRVSDDAHESRCQSRGHQFHEFVCTWTRV